MNQIAPWPITFGLETEVGISVVENPEADVVEESIQLVRCAAQMGSPHLWDYASEDPHQDARGFRARELRQDTDESNFFDQDRQRHYTFAEIKSDFVLRNGARFYNDHTHPEYSTPECATLRDLVAQDKAGERLLEECARLASAQSRRTVRLYKNNTDFAGHSYGCHENYLLSRATPWPRLVEGMTPFLVTRQIYTGAGKVGWESEDKALHGGFQISQRADFFSELIGIDTMNRRPLINTRDEPHADRNLYRRFHVIVGDSNLSEFATWLKVGVTALMLEALQNDPLPSQFQLADPVQTHQAISRDTTMQWPVPLRNGRAADAVTLQFALADWVELHVSLQHPEKRAVHQAWKETLHSLQHDPLSLRSKLDWAAKFSLLSEFRTQENLSWEDPWLQSLDLEYHLLDRTQGLYYGLESNLQIERILDDEDITLATQEPPAQSRAYVRGKCVQKFAHELHTVQWDYLTFQLLDQTYRLDLGQAFPGNYLQRLILAVDQSATAQEFVRALDLKPT